MQQSGINPEASFILGGQIAGRPPKIYLIYPQGNFIASSSQAPFLQIGETKYGKPILDRVIKPELPGLFLEIKSRTWSARDAEVKAERISEMLEILGLDESAILHTDYLDLQQKDNA